MGIELKISDALDIYSAIKLIIEDAQAQTDTLFKFKLLGIMKVLEPHVSNFEIIKNEKIVEYGQDKGNGNYYIPKEDKEAIEKYKSAVDLILENKITFCIDPLTPDEIFNKGVRAEYLIGLYPMIKS